MKNFYKILPLLAITLLGAKCTHAQTVTLSAPKNLTKPGEQIVLTIGITGNPMMTAFEFDESVNQGSLSIPTSSLSDKQIACAPITSTNQSQTCILFGLNQDAITGTAIITETLTMPTSGSVVVNLSNLVGSDANGNSLNLGSAPNLTLTVQAKEDITGDGKVDIQDVVAEVTQIFAARTNPSACTADINGDGKCNVQDIALIVLKALMP